MRAPETVPGTRIVARPEVLDGLLLPPDAVALRLAPDEMFVLGEAVIGWAASIIEAERGFVGWWLTPDELGHVTHHIEWSMTGERPALAQGLVAGVPARLWLETDRALLLVHAAYAHELVARLP